MQFGVTIVDWETFVSMAEAGTWCDAVMELDGSVPWYDGCFETWSDSANEFLATCEAYAIARKDFDEDLLALAEASVGQLFHEHGPQGHDFDIPESMQHYMAAFSPESVRTLLARFDAAPLTTIRKAILDHCEPPYFEEGNRDGEDYLDQYLQVFQLAAERSHGVLFDLS